MSRLLRPTLADGRTISVQEFGESGQPVLLLPGAGADRLALGLQGRALQAAGYRALSLDYPGLGFSRDLPLPGSIDELAEYTLAAADALDLTSFHAVGHSMGSAVAQELALRASGRVRSASLLATWGRLDAFLDLRGRVLSLAFLRDGDERAELLTYFMVSRKMVNAQAAQGQGLGFRGNRLVSEEVLQHYLSIGRDLDRLPRLRSLDLPCLVISGQRDLMTPPEYGQEVADAIPGARHVLLEGPRSAHLFHYEMGAETNAHIIRFLSDVTA